MKNAECRIGEQKVRFRIERKGMLSLILCMIAELCCFILHSAFCILNLKQPDVKVEVKLVKNAEGQFRLDSPTY